MNADLQAISDKLGDHEDVLNKHTDIMMQILTLQDLHGKQLMRVLEAVTMDSSDRGESKLERLLAQLVLNGKEHAARLGQVLAKLNERSAQP
jgi:hypothetical protein